MRDIDGRLASIARHLETIAAGANGFVEHYRAQLIARIAELAPRAGRATAAIVSKRKLFFTPNAAT